MRARVVAPPHVPLRPLRWLVTAAVVNPQLDPFGVGGVVAPPLVRKKVIVMWKRFTSPHGYTRRAYGQHRLNQIAPRRCVLNAGVNQRSRPDRHWPP